MSQEIKEFSTTCESALPISPNGFPSYYLGRFEDYLRRKLPDIYPLKNGFCWEKFANQADLTLLSAWPGSYYGLFAPIYCARFLSSQELSSQGKKWATTTSWRLQEMMEERRVEDASGFACLESTPYSFADAISEDHIKAYSELFPLLQIKDLGVIPNIPYVRCFGGSGIKTALQVARNTLPTILLKGKGIDDLDFKNPPEKTLLPAESLQDWVKSPLYWMLRIEDAVKNDGMYPSYYELGAMISWGMAIHFPSLSPEAKIWVIKTHAALAGEIEDQIAQDPAAYRSFEKSPEFDEAMLKRHSEIYRGNGLQNLGPKDIFTLSKTMLCSIPPEVLVKMGLSCLHEVRTLATLRHK
jgi:hypothetical protein